MRSRVQSRLELASEREHGDGRCGQAVRDRFLDFARHVLLERRRAGQAHHPKLVEGLDGAGRGRRRNPRRHARRRYRGGALDAVVIREDREGLGATITPPQLEQGPNVSFGT